MKKRRKVKITDVKAMIVRGTWNPVKFETDQPGIWKQTDRKPHLVRTFQLSRDAQSEPKFWTFNTP